MNKTLSILHDEHRSISAVLHGLKELARMAQDSRVHPAFEHARPRDQGKRQRIAQSHAADRDDGIECGFDAQWTDPCGRNMLRHASAVNAQ